METITSLSDLKIESILKADPFDQCIVMDDEVTFTSRPLIDKLTFFDKVYTKTAQNKICVRTGSQLSYTKVDLDEWLIKLQNNRNSVVIFISGYAGCGKTVFSQYILKTQLKTVNYDYSYYNYDIGSFYESKQKRISNVIKAHFLEELAKLIRAEEDGIIKEFETLLNHTSSINYINPGAKITRQFLLNGPYKELQQEYSALVSQYNNSQYTVSKDEIINDINNPLLEIDAKFIAVLTAQLDDFELQEILALDYLLRIAVYLAHPIEEHRTIYICYDNMDSIENFDELKTFDNTLTAMRRHIDTYISKIAKDKFYTKKIKRPSFVIMATYRKITAAKVEINNQSERCEDPASENKYIYYIDASHNFKYQDIVKRRGAYFKPILDNAGEDLNVLKTNLINAEKLTQVDFISKRYSSFWNNNYRACVGIMSDAFENHSTETNACLDLLQSKTDGYDNKGLANIGASSIFMGIICKISGNKGIWQADRLNLVELGNDKETYRTIELTSLSRLILTYMSNQFDGEHPRPVSMKELFDEFSDIYGYPNEKNGDDIINAVSKMLTRDETDTWRRPIFYHRNAPNSITDFQLQWQYYCGKTDTIVPYTELLLCDCGYSYVRRLMSDFEFFAARKTGNKHVNLYLTTDLDQLKKIIYSVLAAVEGCCIKLDIFQQRYLQIKKINWSTYLDSSIHPKTRSKNSQLHAERIIFSHICYLDHCRKYHLKYCNDSSKERINNLFKQAINLYLALYDIYIEPKDKRRAEVAANLWTELKELDNAPMDKWEIISIQTNSSHPVDDDDFIYCSKMN